MFVHQSLYGAKNNKRPKCFRFKKCIALVSNVQNITKTNYPLFTL